MNEKNLFYVMSINMVAYIRANGIEPIGEPEKTEENKVKYYFEDSKLLRHLLDTYKEDLALQRFIGKLRQTKSEIQNVKRN